MGHHADLTVEQIATCEVQQCEWVHFDWEMFDVDTMMHTLKYTYTHEGNW